MTFSNINFTVGLPAKMLGGVFPKGDMLLLELLLLLGMCLGVVADKFFRLKLVGGREAELATSSSSRM